MNVFYYILIINGLIAFKIWWDSRAKNNGRTINHLLSAIIDTSFYSASAYLLFKPEWNIVIGATLMALSHRWIFFDAIFAKIHWGTWDYHGTSSWVDRMMIKIRDKIGMYHILVKLIPITIGVLIIIL